MTIALIIISYLLGSINSAVLTCKLLRLPSPYSAGSGNPGATNVLRLGGKKAAAMTLAGDVLKGVVPVVIGHLLQLSYLELSILAFAAVVGHMFPIFFKFKGGKGVATSLGAIIALSPLLGLAFIATWAIIAGVFRYSSLASIVACALAPLYSHFLLNDGTVIPLMLLAVLVIAKHHGNIQRLLKSEESRLGKKQR